MANLSSRRWRWVAPGLVAAGIAATAVVTTTATASDHPDLPTRTAGELLAAVQSAKVDGLSGTVVQTSRLGLPELPTGSGSDAALSLESFATGSRTVRLWLSGEDKQRVALLGDLAESNIVRNGREVWTYSSSNRAVTHLVLPAKDKGSTQRHGGTGAEVTPQDAAQRALAAIDPTTAVTVDRTARVAGRPAYQLVLTPRDSARTLVGSVSVALDSETSLPLRVQVMARGGTAPAFEVGFTKLSLRTPSDDLFRFRAPAGTTVTERRLSARDEAPSGARDGDARGRVGAGQAPSVLGEGWTSVVVAPGAAGATGSRASSALLDRLTTRVPGGRLLTSALVSVLISDDGTIYAGAVPAADLQRVAATGRAL